MTGFAIHWFRSMGSLVKPSSENLKDLQTRIGLYAFVLTISLGFRGLKNLWIFDKHRRYSLIGLYAECVPAVSKPLRFVTSTIRYDRCKTLMVLRITFLRVGRLPWYQRLWPKYSRRWGTCAAALMVHKRNRAPTKCQPTW